MFNFSYLSNTDKATISEHIKNVFEESELDEKVVVRKFRTTTKHSDGVWEVRLLNSWNNRVQENFLR